MKFAKYAALALMLPGLAFGQSLPSPTFNRITNSLVDNNILAPYGWAANQTAGVFSLGAANECVMGGAQNGQGAGGIGTYATIDSVALCSTNTGQAPLYTVAGTYDATHFYPTAPLTSGQMSQLKYGTWIQTTGNGYRSWIQSWAADGTSVTVIGWWVPGVAGYVTPSGTPTANFGAVTKVWNANGVVDLEPTSFATAAEGYELDVFNNKSNSVTMDGFDAVQLGSFGARYAFQARGLWTTDYIARGGSAAGFLYDPTIDNVPTGTTGGFASRQNTGIAFAVKPAGTGVQTFAVDAATGNISLGANTILSSTNVKLNAPGSVYVDFIEANNVGSQGYNMRLINAFNGGLQMYGLDTGSGTNFLLATYQGAQANSFNFSGAATGLPPTIGVTGDANAGLKLTGAGTGLVSVGNGLQLPAYTVAALPACAAGNAGTIVFATDLTTPTYNGALTGGGAVKRPVSCNGTAWVS